jgi:putative transposase
MDESQVQAFEDEALSSDEVVLGEHNFITDPSQVVIEAADPHRLRYRLIEWLAEAPNRKVKSDRKKKIAETLNLSTRQVERLLEKYWDNKLHETTGTQRADKGTHRIHEYWQEYIQEVYLQSVKEKHPLKPVDVAREVKRHAEVDLRHEPGDYPHQATVYRILKPLVEEERRKKQLRNAGSGSYLSVITRNGQLLKAEYSNQIIQIDHTKLDIRIVDENKNLLRWRPWLTNVVDTFSTCLLGYHLWAKQPGAHEVALALRHAILPKQYPPEYELEKKWDVYGPPLQYLFTDGGKDLSKAKLIKAIGKSLGFKCELRDRPNQGGVVERLFGTINTEFLAALPGYIERSIDKKAAMARAEKEACLTIEDLDKMLAVYFCDDYNHGDYPGDKSKSRFERWFIGMGKKLPEPMDERELDVCLMKEDQRCVQNNGSVYFECLTYRCEELKGRKNIEYVTLKYDPDHILTLYVYSQSTEDQEEEFIGFAHAINMDRQDMSLEELEEINKERNKASRDRSNYDALLALDKRKKLVNQRKQEKKEQQLTEQKRLREKSKKNSKVVELRKIRSEETTQRSTSAENSSNEAISNQSTANSLNASTKKPAQSSSPKPSSQERHKLILPKNRSLNRIW